MKRRVPRSRIFEIIIALLPRNLLELLDILELFCVRERMSLEYLLF